MQVTTPRPLPAENVGPNPLSMLAADPFFRNMDLRDATRLLRRRLQLIVGVMIACALLSLLTSLLLAPRYRAEAVVLLDPRQTHVMAGEVVSGLPSDNTAVRSEIDIIQSDAVVNRVVDKMNLAEDPELHPKRWWSVLNPFKLFAPPVSPEDQAARNRAMVEELVEKRLKVDNDGRSYSIKISYQSTDPKKAALIANAFADEYLVDQLEAKYEATARASKWLDSRLSTLKEQVETAEKAVEAFRQKSKLIEVDGTTVSARQLSDTNTQLTEARGVTAQAEARLRSAQNMLKSKGGTDSAADVLASPLIQRLREQEAEVRRQETEMATKYGDLHPKMINMRAQYRDLQAKIEEEVRKIIQALANEVDIARARQGQIEKALREQEERAGVEMRDSVTLRQLQREADANRMLYEGFLNRFKQTSAQEQMQAPDSRIIARASPPASPSFPIKWLFMVIGLVVGGVLGVMLAYLVEYFDRGFRSAAQVEEATGIPVVGLIPTLGGVTDQLPEKYVVEKPLSSYSEALRTVRTAIHFSNVDQPPKIVMVTSAVPGEGKTTFCLSLARSLAAAGNKILLIDADMRRPRIAAAAELADAKGGLAALLSGEQNFAAVLCHDPIVPGFDILPSVGKVPNAQDLLGSQQMHKMLQDAAQHYDLVIVDTPPIMAVSDAAMAARSVDSIIFLVRWATTPRDTAVQALKQLHSFGIKMAGVVLTQVNLVEHAKYGGGYYHHNYNDYYAN